MAFGTGSHPTTQLCLRFLEDYLKPGDSFLDVGCGSGILTIAAAKLGAGVLSAVDIDELAVHSTIENLKLNGLAEKVRVIHGDLVKQIQEPVRVVTANIVADAILRLLPNIEPLLVSQGLFIASGIITTREEDLVKATEEAGLSILEVRREGDWVAILAQKPL
ncbi:Ribosomal protein L11 methyltransferase [bioreactor metagenome]|uniref:Ribosomal protein L11 methyltransferase n=1 Tax=bioreactor metagenome TaxID=1076179 RepID=A0A645F9A7_9ZZZZ